MRYPGTCTLVCPSFRTSRSCCWWVDPLQELCWKIFSNKMFTLKHNTFHSTGLLVCPFQQAWNSIIKAHGWVVFFLQNLSWDGPEFVAIYLAVRVPAFLFLAFALTSTLLSFNLWQTFLSKMIVLHHSTHLKTSSLVCSSSHVLKSDESSLARSPKVCDQLAVVRHPQEFWMLRQLSHNDVAVCNRINGKQCGVYKPSFVMCHHKIIVLFQDRSW